MRIFYLSFAFPRTRSRLGATSVALFALLLVACGSSGDGGSATIDADNGSGAGGASAPLTSGFAVEADRQSTVAGGASITLTTNADSSANVQWTLAPGSPGSLVVTSGNSVQYVPPVDTIDVDKVVNIIASNGTVTSNVIIHINSDSSTNTGTTDAEPATPPVPEPSDNGTAVPEPGIYLIAGNDFGAGMADGPGSAARFDTPTGIARDAQGNLYIADRFNNVVRRISPQGVVSTLAGAPGDRGHADGIGAAARFSLLAGIAVDSSGNIYVADYGNAVIRRVTPGGEVTTVAGEPGQSGSVDGLGSAARLSGNPSALAFGPDGNLYIAETNTVRRMTPAGEVTTLAGQAGVAGFDDGDADDARFTSLNGIAVDSTGIAYVSDGGWGRNGGILSDANFFSASIRRIALDGTVTTLAGRGSAEGFDDVVGFADGSGTTARFSYPQGLVVDGSGDIFVADRGNRVIRRVSPEGVVSTIAGVAGQGGSADGAIGDARFMAPAGLALDTAGILYLTDAAHHTVRRVVPGENVSTLAGAAPLSGSADGTRSAALFNEPRGITRDAQGNFYVADTGNATIRRIAADGAVITLAGSAGQSGADNGMGTAARFDRPTDVAADLPGNILVSDFDNRLIRRITPDGIVSTYAGIPGQTGYVDGPAASAQFFEPQAVAVDATGNVYVADRAGDAVRKITPQGQVSTLFGHQDTSYAPVGFGTGNELIFPQDVAVDAAGNVYAIDSNAAIRKITPAGEMTTLAGVPFRPGTQDGTGAQARFNYPQSLTVDGAGNVYVADARAIRRITPTGVVTTVAGASVTGNDGRLRAIHRPLGLVMTGPNTLAFTAGDGVFALQLP